MKIEIDVLEHDLYGLHIIGKVRHETTPMLVGRKSLMVALEGLINMEIDEEEKEEV